MHNLQITLHSVQTHPHHHPMPHIMSSQYNHDHLNHPNINPYPLMHCLQNRLLKVHHLPQLLYLMLTQSTLLQQLVCGTVSGRA
jgi:hypothetical protein